MLHNTADTILSEIKLLRRKKSLVVAAIDGRGGAGKSSLARSVVANLPNSVHVEHECFHLPKSKVISTHRFDSARQISEVILPFGAGAPKLTFFRYNWGYLTGIPDGFHETLITLEGKEILVIEGCETLHCSLIPHLDLQIWPDTDAKISRKRGIRRDIDEYNLDPDNVHAAWVEWSAWEAESLVRDDRR